MAPRFPLARGWERQLDIKYNSLFYDGTLTAATYHTWLHKLAVRYVAVSDADLDYSAHEETALIDRGLPYLRLVFRSAPLARLRGRRTRPRSPQGAATLQRLGANSLTLRATRPGTVTCACASRPTGRSSGLPGCVIDAAASPSCGCVERGRSSSSRGFSLGRIGATTPRCD